MTLLEKFKSLFTTSSTDPQAALDKLTKQESRLSESLTNLIFQQGKLREKRKGIIYQLEDIAIELDELVSENDEEACLYLLEKTDQLKQDVSFIDSELESLNISIQELQRTQSDLVLNKDKYKNLVISHSYKLESLKAKKDIKNQIQAANGIRTNTNNPIELLQDKILKAEAEIKVLENTTNPIEERLKEKKRNRKNTKYLEQFNKLKLSKGVIS